MFMFLTSCDEIVYFSMSMKTVSNFFCAMTFFLTLCTDLYWCNRVTGDSFNCYIASSPQELGCPLIIVYIVLIFLLYIHCLYPPICVEIRKGSEALSLFCPTPMVIIFGLENPGSSADRVLDLLLKGCRFEFEIWKVHVGLFS